MTTAGFGTILSMTLEGPDLDRDPIKAPRERGVCNG